MVTEAHRLFRDGKYTDAEKRFRNAYGIDQQCRECVEFMEKSQKAAALREKGLKDLKEKRFREAVRALNALVSVNPQDASANIYLIKARHDWAVDLFHRAEYQRARELFQSVQASSAECSDCRGYLERIDEKTAEVRQRTIEARLKQGIDYYKASRYQQAVEVLQRVTAMAPGHAKAGEYLSKAHFHLAVESCKKNDPASTKHLTAFHRHSNCHSCRTMAAAFKKKYFQKGQQAFYDDNYEGAIANWELVRCLDPDYPEVEANIEAAHRVLEMFEN